jgi:hypothetical protein
MIMMLPSGEPQGRGFNVVGIRPERAPRSRPLASAPSASPRLVQLRAAKAVRFAQP